MVPALFFGNLTMLFTILTRSTNGGALLASIVLVLIFLFQGGWNDSIIYPFLNLQELAQDLPSEEFFRIAIVNRLLVLGVAFCPARPGPPPHQRPRAVVVGNGWHQFTN